MDFLKYLYGGFSAPVNWIFDLFSNFVLNFFDIFKESLTETFDFFLNLSFDADFVKSLFFDIFSNFF